MRPTSPTTHSSNSAQVKRPHCSGVTEKSASGAPASGCRGELSAVVVRQDAFHDGGELQEPAADRAEEPVESRGVVGVAAVDYGQRVPLHAVFLQQRHAPHHRLERGASLPVAAVEVVRLGRSVERDSHQPAVFAEELAPRIVQKRARWSGCCCRSAVRRRNAVAVRSRGGRSRASAAGFRLRAMRRIRRRPPVRRCSRG